jgi:SAM-dependent methyltransferase
LSATRIFDQHHYELLNRARGDVVTRLLGQLKPELDLENAIDVGCGLGHFSGLLNSLGFHVIGVDGRAENVNESARRFPAIQFLNINVEDAQITQLGTFDLVFCFGLLYHLENPLLAIRNLRAMTSSMLLVEGLIYPGDDPIMGLVDETEYEDQGLRNFAFYPTESCLVKMLYRVGYANVYRFLMLAAHPEYRDAPGRPRNRTILAASLKPLTTELLAPIKEPSSATKPWLKTSNLGLSVVSRLRRIVNAVLPRS